MTPDEIDEHDLNVTTALGELNDATTRADAALRDAERALADLMGGNAWWVELAEGVDGADARHCLRTAQRAVRHLVRAVARATPPAPLATETGKDVAP